MHTHYQQSCPLIIRTTNEPLGDPLMSYNNKLQLTHTSIIYNLAFILWVIEIKLSLIWN